MGLIGKKRTTISSLLVLKTARDAYREQLGAKYREAIEPFCEIILKVMEVQQINEFDAIAKIKNELPIYKQPGAELHFGCALYEIVEETRLAEIEK